MKAEIGIIHGSVRGMALAGLALALCSACADAVPDENGGMIEMPARGCVAVVDCRGARADDELDEAVKRLENITQVRFVRRKRDGFTLDATPRDVMSEAEVRLAVFVVDDKSLPMSLLATEANWGLLNIAALGSGSTDAVALAARVRKAFMRVAVLTLGAWRSDSQGSYLRKVSGPDDIDRLKGRGMTLFELRNVMNHLLDMDITRPYSVSYRDLCREGKAPAPTNDVQRAIWEKVQADKERGPTNPITIPPPKK